MWVTYRANHSTPAHSSRPAMAFAHSAGRLGMHLSRTYPPAPIPEFKWISLQPTQGHQLRIPQRFWHAVFALCALLYTTEVSSTRDVGATSFRCARNPTCQWAYANLVMSGTLMKCFAFTPRTIGRFLRPLGCFFLSTPALLFLSNESRFLLGNTLEFLCMGRTLCLAFGLKCRQHCLPWASAERTGIAQAVSASFLILSNPHRMHRVRFLMHYPSRF